MKIKEGLSEFFGPVIKTGKYLDGKVLRTYSKFVHKYEKKGGDKYELARTLIWSSTMPFSIGIVFSHYPLIYPSKIISKFIVYGIWTANDLAHTIISEKNQTNSDTKAIDSSEYLLGQIGKKTRLLGLGTSLFFTSKGLFNIVNSIKTNDYSFLFNSFTDFLLAYSFFTIPSSSYIKEGNDKLLENQPMWKDALDLVRDIMPKTPITNPLTITHQDLDNRVLDESL